MSKLRALAPLLFLMLTLVAWPQQAAAAPSASGSFNTNNGASGSSSGGSYDWPELVIGGNALSAHLPFQIGAVGYMPKGRLSIQYDRQLSAALAHHWVHLGASLLFDRGDWENFRLDGCDSNLDGSCQPGGVVGYDIYAGYTHRFYVANKPWLVPHLKGSLGFGWWALPKVSGGRHQSRIKSWTLNLRPGGGLRIFLLDQLGVGMDVNIPFGFLVHTDIISDGAAEGSEDKNGGFLLGFETLLAVEYRF